MVTNYIKVVAVSMEKNMLESQSTGTDDFHMCSVL